MATPKSTFKLRYFNFRGLAEPIRFILAYVGQEYEDIRVPQEDWPAIKPTTPFGNMPILEVDGQSAGQSMAILRYLGKRFGLTGSNPWEELLVDGVADTFADFRQKLIAPWQETDEEVKAKKKATLESETIPFYLAKLENCAKQNNGHLALSKLTYADFYFASMIESLYVMIKPDFLDHYPNLKKVVDNVRSIESIKAWIAKRPVTEF
ncbi:hypothetical protein HA402_005698 [Bradysia odoriphaga]|nr:hypothetical protein HA402_005698 [Bradysia odoriphaga]